MEIEFDERPLLVANRIVGGNSDVALAIEEGTVLSKATELTGYSIHATDGHIGRVSTVLFDDEAWTVRYFVVDTGTWLPGRKVLIAPVAIRRANRTTSSLDVSLTRDQVKKSPDIDTDRPVSRRHEEDYYRYYSYPFYWSGLLPGAYPGIAAHRETPAREHGAGSQESHLRDVRAVKGYHISATDGEIGHVEDFLVDPESWTIRYLVVDTSNWLGGRRVLIAPAWGGEVSWEQSTVHVTATRQAVKDSPEYDMTAQVSRPYEERLYGHYGATGYWPLGGTDAERAAERVADSGRLSRLKDLDDLEVAAGDPDVRGWKVLASDGLPIGTVEHLIVDASKMKVRYLEVGLKGQAAESGSRDVLIPLEYVDLDKAKDEVRLGTVPLARILALPTFAGLPIDAAHERRLRVAFGAGSRERQSR